jgi:hypothetical protein
MYRIFGAIDIWKDICIFATQQACLVFLFLRVDQVLTVRTAGGIIFRPLCNPQLSAQSSIGDSKFDR